MNRNILLGALLAASAATALTGCFPIIATGMVTTALVATDRRSSDIVVEDQLIESRVANRIDAKFSNDAHVNVHSFNRIVLLTGEVRTEELRKAVEDVARASDKVRTVVNETASMSTTTFSNRASDTLLANEIRARYVSEGHFQATVVATVVERHEVFLMGLVTPAEAAEAVRVASTTSGVERVVKVFEYIDPASLPPPPARQDSAKPLGQK